MSTVDDYLAHHGILGQKWGVRHDRAVSEHAKKKQARLDRENEIRKARLRNIKRQGNLNAAAAETYLAKSEKARQAANDAYHRLEKKYATHPDNDLAEKMTRGEKIATAAYVGLLGVSMASLATYGFLANRY